MASFFDVEPQETNKEINWTWTGHHAYTSWTSVCLGGYILNCRSVKFTLGSSTSTEPQRVASKIFLPVFQRETLRKLYNDGVEIHEPGVYFILVKSSTLRRFTVVSCVSHVAHFLRKQFLKIVQTEWEPFSASQKGPVWPNQHTIVEILSL